jgi:hypothetical protein
VSDELEAMVFEALGEASMCWETVEAAGTFQSEKCSEIGDRLVARIRDLNESQKLV